ncbi:uncharacterized protein LOC106151156 [Lingula anatina]|uniref:Uncharacterized protein LOC106151156 n=1 Tax=Lingula anatina TaxID=7574 RepID=A0A1S3H3K4_LINAN|nr:uncharacterized protein LOC106151156 [Lingula anatina]|eukprot:XP_013379719.2 uncharacterized protein LOC106151156 [Lingula anatina]
MCSGPDVCWLCSGIVSCHANTVCTTCNKGSKSGDPAGNTWLQKVVPICLFLASIFVSLVTVVVALYRRQKRALQLRTHQSLIGALEVNSECRCLGAQINQTEVSLCQCESSGFKVIFRTRVVDQGNGDSNKAAVCELRDEGVLSERGCVDESCANHPSNIQTAEGIGSSCVETHAGEMITQGVETAFCDKCHRFARQSVTNSQQESANHGNVAFSVSIDSVISRNDNVSFPTQSSTEVNSEPTDSRLFDRVLFSSGLR